MISGWKSTSLRSQKMHNLCVYVGAVPLRRLKWLKSSNITLTSGSHVSEMEGMMLL